MAAKEEQDRDAEAPCRLDFGTTSFDHNFMGIRPKISN